MKRFKKKGKPTIWNVLLLTGLLSAIGCSSTKVASQRDPSVDLSRFQTFDWMPASANTPMPNPLLDKQLQSSIQTDLGKIGVQRAQSDMQPDFLIARSLTIQNVATNEGGVGLGLGFGVAPGVGVGVSAPVGSQTRVTPYGTLTLSFVDSRSNSEIWRATSTTSLGGSDQGQDALKGVVEKMVDDFGEARKKPG